MIEKLIAGLPERDRAQLVGMRIKGMQRREDSPEDEEIRRFLAAIDDEFLRRVRPPESGWTHGAQGDPRYRMHDGQRVGVVQRLEAHRHTNGDVYLAEILGQPFSDRFRHVDDARKAVDEAFADQFELNPDQADWGKS